jgi:broad specificity phosphatase PhoE
MGETLNFMHHAPAPRRPYEIVGSGTDRDLDEYGLFLAANNAGRVKKLLLSGVLRAVDEIVTSPLKRAVQTAEIVAEVNDLEVRVDDRLTAQNFGVLEGMTFDEIRRDPELAKNMWEHIPHEDRDSHRVPGGESNGDFVERIREVRADLQDWDGSQLVITHGSVIDAVMSVQRGMRLDEVEGANRKYEGLVLQDVGTNVTPLSKVGEQFDHIPGTVEAIEREDMESLKVILLVYLTNPHLSDQERVHLSKLINFI